jgi:hypothetical protein
MREIMINYLVFTRYPSKRVVPLGTSNKYALLIKEMSYFKLSFAAYCGLEG